MRKYDDPNRQPAPSESETRPTASHVPSGVNRRDFVRTSPAGAGGLALPGAVLGAPLGASTTAEDTLDTTGEKPAGLQACREDWSEPWEWDVREHWGDELRGTEIPLRSLAPSAGA